MKDGPPLFLTHEELISPGRTSPLLTPGHIPVHPLVYDANFPYQLDFLRRVNDSIPGLIEQDLEAIAAILGEKSPVELRGRRVGSGKKAIDLDDVKFYAYGPARRYFSLHRGGSSMALGDHDGVKTEPLPYWGHPMDIEKFEAYKIPTNDSLPTVHVWHTTNMNDYGFYWKLYLRNYAIGFNNLALQELGSDRGQT